MLEAPDDIFTFGFNPSNPNHIAGGCLNGQVRKRCMHVCSFEIVTWIFFVCCCANSQESVCPCLDMVGLLFCCLFVSVLLWLLIHAIGVVHTLIKLLSCPLSVYWSHLSTHACTLYLGVSNNLHSHIQKIGFGLIIIVHWSVSKQITPETGYWCKRLHVCIWVHVFFIGCYCGFPVPWCIVILLLLVRLPFLTRCKKSSHALRTSVQTKRCNMGTTQAMQHNLNVNGMQCYISVIPKCTPGGYVGRLNHRLHPSSLLVLPEDDRICLWVCLSNAGGWSSLSESWTVCLEILLWKMYTKWTLTLFLLSVVFLVLAGHSVGYLCIWGSSSQSEGEQAWWQEQDGGNQTVWISVAGIPTLFTVFLC